MHKKYFLLFFGLIVVQKSFCSDLLNTPITRAQLLMQQVEYVTGEYKGLVVYAPLFDLRNKDLSGADLRLLNFWVTNFEGANLSGANLTGASFSRPTKLRGTDLRNVNFEGIYIDHKIHSPEYTKGFFRRAGALVD